MRAVVLLIALILCLGCEKKEVAEKPACCVLISVDLDIHYTDATGNNLFPNPSKGFVQNDVNLYIEKNGVRQLVSDGAPGYISDYPRRYFFYTENSLNYVRVFTDNNIQGDSAITYLKLDGKFEDTIKTTFIRTGSSLLINKAWINGKLLAGKRVTIAKL